MRIGKTVKIITSPKRTARKFNEKKQEKPVPVNIPKKVPEEVQAWKYMPMWGMKYINHSYYLTASS